MDFFNAVIHLDLLPPVAMKRNTNQSLKPSTFMSIVRRITAVIKLGTIVLPGGYMFTDLK